MSAVLSIAGHLVEVGEDTARTEAATAVAVNTVAVATVEAETAVVADTVEAETAVNTAAVATVEAEAVGTAVASLKGPAAPISAATGNESVPASMARRRLSGSHA